MTDIHSPGTLEGAADEPERRRPVEREPVPREQRRVEAPLSPPSATTGLLGVFQNRYLLRLLVRREISARYQGSVLGLIWSYINPLTQFLIYYVVMGVLFGLHKDVPNFAIHMFCGIIIVHFFNETFNAGTRSIVRNKSLVRKMALPREMFPVASMLVSGYHVLPQLVIMVIVCLALGWAPTVVGMLSLILALMIIALLGTALALIFSAANVFFRDVSNVASILTNFVRFGVPMIYPYTLVGDRFGSFAAYYLFNPIADAVLLFQRAFWVGTTPNPAFVEHKHIPGTLTAYSLLALVVSAVVLVIAQVIFSRLQDQIPEHLA